MLNRLVVLVDNRIEEPCACTAEHGLSLWVETTQGSFLFDTGAGRTLLRNADQLGINLKDAKRVILSHGHYDHTGGLLDLLKMTAGLEVILHPFAFEHRWWVDGERRKAIGMPYERADVVKAGAKIKLVEKGGAILDGCWITGEIPRPDGKLAEANMVTSSGGRESPDGIPDDMAMFVQGKKGLTVVLGCCHAGLENTLKHICEMAKTDRVYRVIGGLHLMHAANAEIDRAVEALDQYRIEELIPLHCTGSRAAARLAMNYKGKLLFGGVGTVVVDV